MPLPVARSKTMYAVAKRDEDGKIWYVGRKGTFKNPKWTDKSSEARWYAYRSYADEWARWKNGTYHYTFPVQDGRDLKLCPDGGQNFSRKRTPLRLPGNFY